MQKRRPFALKGQRRANIDLKIQAPIRKYVRLRERTAKKEGGREGKAK